MPCIRPYFSFFGSHILFCMDLSTMGIAYFCSEDRQGTAKFVLWKKLFLRSDYRSQMSTYEEIPYTRNFVRSGSSLEAILLECESTVS